ncbi:MAG: 23S rRNA (guanosine(2251)-2'-O)-methyltransferase RlmB [Chloroflexi bacterium]|nr:23S rRNA (guanosine(2251)-2'-O)-methyltransferase RlmB [Chloroflexota bacterium]
MLYGRNTVYEALRAGRRQCSRLLIADSIRDSRTLDGIFRLARSRRVPIERVRRRALDQLVAGNHQGIALEAGDFPYVDLDEILIQAYSHGSVPLLLLLDLLQDPQNLGSLLRTADATGVHGVILQERRAVGVTPSVVNASSGAVEHLCVAQVTNLGTTIDDLKTRGIWVAGLEATPKATRYDQADLTAPLALVVGSEGQGLRRLVREKCDYLIALPMFGQVASLNAAVAGSIVLYEVVRQRTK